MHPNWFLNCAIVKLEASPTATLAWGSPRKDALLAMAKGKKILWQLELGLFDRLPHPLSHASQFMTLTLAIDHFRDQIWEEFSAFSRGVALYLGSPIFGLHDDKLLARDIGADYIRQLACGLPDRIPRFVCFDGESINDPLLFALLTNKESYEQIEVIAFNAPFKATEDASLGICLPPNEMPYPLELGEVFARLVAENIPFRIISEAHLTGEWDGLDCLIYSPQSISSSGKRKLSGFCAAGGKLISVGEKLGYPEEMTLEEFNRVPLYSFS